MGGGADPSVSHAINKTILKLSDAAVWTPLWVYSNRTEESLMALAHISKGKKKKKSQRWRCLCRYVWHGDNGVFMPTAELGTLKHAASSSRHTHEACTVLTRGCPDNDSISPWSGLDYYWEGASVYPHRRQLYKGEQTLNSADLSKLKKLRFASYICFLYLKRQYFFYI